MWIISCSSTWFGVLGWLIKEYKWRSILDCRNSSIRNKRGLILLYWSWRLWWFLIRRSLQNFICIACLSRFIIVKNIIITIDITVCLNNPIILFGLMLFRLSTFLLRHQWVVTVVYGIIITMVTIRISTIKWWIMSFIDRVKEWLLLLFLS